MKTPMLTLIGCLAVMLWTVTGFAGEIHQAAGAGDLDRLRSLLSKDESLVKAVTERGSTALHVASQNGHADAIGLLLDYGADLEATDNYGATPLAWAVLRGHHSAAELLISRGANVNPAPLPGFPPVVWVAVDRGYADIVKALLANGAETGYVDEHHGATLLHLACTKGYAEIVELLVAAGFDVDARDEDDKTPLFYAAKHGNKSCANLLISNGADQNEELEENYGKSPYMDNPPKPGEAVAWYLNHRGWAIKTSNHLLVIDYEQFRQVVPTEPSLANGFVTPAEIREQTTCVLFTTWHGDPGELSFMHTLEDSLANISYVHNIDEPWRGPVQATYMKSGEKKQLGDIEIVAIRPTSEQYMPTMAYLCNLDGLSVFYAGFSTDDIEVYKRSLGLLDQHEDRIDIAFLPLPEPGQEDTSDFKYFLERLRPRAVCVLDPKRREHLFPGMKEKVADWGFETQVFCANSPGDMFEYVPKR